MRKATLINNNFSVNVYPDILRYSIKKDMYGSTQTVPNGEGGIISVNTNKVDVFFQIFCSKWSREIEIETETHGVTQTIVQTEFVTFGEPVLFDGGVRTIPYSLYLLLESFRDEPSSLKLIQINNSVQSLIFENSLDGFVLQVENIE